MLEHLGDFRRTHPCGAVRADHAGTNVRLVGWVHRTRDHGGVLFVDLRDRYGVVQVVFHPDGEAAGLAERARELKSEYVLAVEGTVTRRPPEMVNAKLPTGEIEVTARALRVLNDSRTPPFVPDEAANVSEDLRLEYRFIDLRRPELNAILGMRHRVCIEVRRYLDTQGFWEIETPMLVRPTPEGARDYLVPSRVHENAFYALPQSPQLYKQILMVSGMDRYFQLARCLRDEDLRADRQPEHTQIDMEMSFIGEDEVFAVVEGILQGVWEKELGVALETPFPRMVYREAMERYGSDKPDVRFGFELVGLETALEGSGFRIFDEALAGGRAIKGIRIAGGGALSRKEQDELEALVQRYGAKGLARAKVAGGKLEGGFGKFVTEDAQRRVVATLGAEEGDLVTVVADRWGTTCRSLGALRSKLGNDWLAENPAAAAPWRFLWVVEFPLFEEDADSGAFVPAHHMFTMPMDEDLPYLESDPARVRGRLYDLVLNGFELGSGSIRIHRRDIQEAVMRVVGVGADEAEHKFGFLLKAFQFGAPPHGGIALGLDRIIMLMARRASLRDTIAFPKTTSAASLMDGCPTAMTDEDLRDLHIRLAAPPAGGKG